MNLIEFNWIELQQPKVNLGWNNPKADNFEKLVKKSNILLTSTSIPVTKFLFCKCTPNMSKLLLFDKGFESKTLTLFLENIGVS